jgi:hypothetical protein
MTAENVRLLNLTRNQPKRCPACGGRGWRLDLDERCSHCNPCCEEHFPSEVMSLRDQAEHVCPVCSWAANPAWLAQIDGCDED